MMFKKIGIILAGIALAGFIIPVFSQKYVSTTSLFLIPLSAVLITIFFFLKVKVEWVLMVITFNVMIGAARFFEGPILNFNRLLGIIIICLFFIDFFILKRRRFYFSIQGIWILLFAMAIIFSTFFSINLNTSLKALRLCIRVFLLYFLITNIITSSLWMRRFIYLLLLTGVMLTTFSIIDHYSYRKYDMPITEKLGITSMSPEMHMIMISKRDRDRLYGAIGYTKDVNFFALMLVTLFPLSLAFINDKKKRSITFCYISAILILVGIIFSLSRGAILALIIITLLMIKRSLFTKKLLIAMLMIIIICLPIFSTQSLKRVYSIALYPFNTKRTNSVDIQNVLNRIYYIQAGTQIFFDHPFVGVGIGNFPETYVKYAPPEARHTPRDSHNTYIQILTETGLIGFIVFIAGIILNFLVIKRIKNITMENNDEFFYRIASLFEISFIAFLIGCTFVSAAYIDIFWIIIGSTTALYFIVNQRDIFYQDSR